jgi:hypothetical protein
LEPFEPQFLRTFAIFFKSSLLPKIAIRDGTGAATSRRFALPTKIWKTTPCKVADSCWHDAVSDSAKTFDMSGKSAALLHHRAIRKTPMLCPTMGPFGAIKRKKSF